MTEPTPTPPPTLEPTGERMVPEHAAARTFWEHVGRYRFALGFARGRRVLDVACGEGYGAAALLRAGAAGLVGVDRAPEVVAHARARYGIDARAGDALDLPLADRSVDLVVSFETIEHVDDQARFLDECARVLAPGGTLVVSTPNRPVYSAEGHHNPHHHRELDEAEFRALLAPRFGPVGLFTQVAESAAWWSPRSLPAERSPWRRVRGFWRLSAALCPAIRSELPAAVRADPVAAILADPAGPGRLFDPYRVRPLAAGSGERPYYYVAVARRP